MQYSDITMKNTLFFSLALATLAFGSCSTDDGIPTGKTPVTIKMTDAPANYDAIYLNIDEIEIRTVSGSEVIDVDADPFDILQYRFGRDTVIAAHDVPSGRIQEIRLKLEDEGNYIVVDGQEYPLTTPSGQSSGVKLKVHDDLIPNVAYTLLIDFDAAKSVHQTGNGKWMLKPVLRAIPVATSGAIEGVVAPFSAWPNVYAITGTDTIGTITNPLGKFYFPGVDQGTYKLVIEPTEPGYDTVSQDVIVTQGKVTNVGTINLGTVSEN